MPRSCKLLTVLVLGCVAVHATPSSSYEAKGPLIREVHIDHDLNQLVILGEGFRWQRLIVEIGNFGDVTEYCEADVYAEPEMISCDFSSAGGLPAAGDYNVVVEGVDWKYYGTIRKSDQHALTIGAVGPQGPEGPQGLPGADGVDGLKGPQGSEGPQGLEGPQGPVGLSGANGSDGMRGANCWETFIENDSTVTISVQHPLTGQFISIPPGGRFVGLDRNEDGTADFQDCQGTAGLLNEATLAALVQTACAGLARTGDDDDRSTEVFVNPTQSAFLANDICKRGVFVTSEVYDGDLGGLGGADDKCQALADARSLGGDWRAWLSRDGLSVIGRLPMPGIPYRLLGADGARTGPLVRDGFRAMIEIGSLRRGIDRDESGATISGEVRVWTGTGTGAHHNGPDCQEWNSNSSGSDGRIGNATKSGSGWTSDGSPNCSNELRLYCFEQ